jgi:glycosyltransferase involved in cell wall biosynthesis
MMISCRLSVVVPLHNEESNLPILLARLRAVFDRLDGGPHQIVLVDDGSTDGTWEILGREARADDRLVALGLSRNFGHQAALTAGLDHADGDAVVVMDGDLQDPPEAIPEFMAWFGQGYDVVYAQRVRRKEPWWLRLCYFLFYRMMVRLSDINLPVDAGDFGLMSRRVVQQLRQMREHHRYLRGLRSWVGFRQIGIPIERSERHSGRSQYGMIGLLKLASDAIFAFSAIPIRAAALLGAAAVGLSGVYTAYAVLEKIFLRRSPQGFTAIVVLITFLSGILLLFLGIVGEYVGRIYEEVKGRPLYLVDRVIGIQAHEKGHVVMVGSRPDPEDEHPNST